MTSSESSRCLCRLFRQSIQVNGVHQVAAVAISGGADSMCVAHLAQQLASRTWTCRMPCAASLPAFESPVTRVHGISIDHGLRKESSLEVNNVLDWCREQGVDSSITRLQWPRGNTVPKTSALLAEARHLRYRALADACKASGAVWLLTGHHAGMLESTPVHAWTMHSIDHWIRSVET
jgi:tRNA(Ile)-lysidine synthase